MNEHAPVWLDINIGALAHNIKQLKSIISPQTELMAVVKANAYGHGAVEVARTALASGATRLGVARVTEGTELRQAGIEAPVLVLGYTVPEDYPAILNNSLTQTIYDLRTARELSSLASQTGKKALVHIKVDTGMGRLGFFPDNDGLRDIINIARLPHLELEGIFTHFASADCRDKSYANKQWHSFMEFIELLTREGLEFPLRHAANSAALLDMPETHLDMVRAGIAVYGVSPAREVDISKVHLQPVMAVKARVAHVKRVAAGSGISYGVTYITPSSTVVATIPAGYADGYNRLLSSKGEVLIRGQKAPVIGRICMDQFMVDAGHLPDLTPGEEVVLMGRQGNAEITADEIAEKIGTISYEVLCAMNSRVPKHFIKEHAK
ncbi:alanine racemase [Desulfallas thermosapovorans]|uniref:Alanine racemase n=1 Tax=Desulfallas thermosapovorans DSM 6562 TaxID=1121431 RepID=A0A5S4ZQG8_9FIRM|nr:alanine racemase [Desulfallas thermosapovorans]TYO94949.1 alanine racemase [Desulfallas thermosapovorans DSM 6562]